MIKSLGINVARWVLTATGNQEIAKALQALPKAWSMPYKIWADDRGPRLEFGIPVQNHPHQDQLIECDWR